jgi:hypothetical protein
MYVYFFKKKSIYILMLDASYYLFNFYKKKEKGTPKVNSFGRVTSVHCAAQFLKK